MASFATIKYVDLLHRELNHMRQTDWEIRKDPLVEELMLRADLEEILAECDDQNIGGARVRTSVRRAMRRLNHQQKTRDRAEKLELPNFGRF